RPRKGRSRLLPPAIGQSKAESFRQGLWEIGYYIEGMNILIEPRWAEGRGERLAELAAALVRLDVAVIVTEIGQAARVAKQATQTIPIVMAVGSDPVAAGLVASLARPGGNITGLTLQLSGLSGKRLELLKEVALQTTRVAFLWNATNPAHGAFWVATEPG